MDASTPLGRKPRVLLAATQPGLPVLRRLWRSHAGAAGEAVMSHYRKRAGSALP